MLGLFYGVLETRISQYNRIAGKSKVDNLLETFRNCEKRLLASSCLPVRLPSVRMGSHWTDFNEI